MAESIFRDILQEKIKVEKLFEWLLNCDFAINRDEKVLRSDCNQVDFITYFLNFIHEEASSHERLQNVNTTKKRIEEMPALVTEKKEGRADVNYIENFPPIEALHIFSTPKTEKPSVDLNLSYFSPVSPIYTKNSFTTPRNKHMSTSAQKSIDKTPTLYLSDFILPNSTPGKKKVQKNLNQNLFHSESRSKRKINPTNLCEKKLNTSFKKNENSFNFNSDFVELPVENMLADQQVKVLTKEVVTKHVQIRNKCDLTPNIGSVTFKKELNVIVRVFCALLRNSLVLNFTSELYFLISVLLSKSDNFSIEKEYITKENDPKKIFGTVHNCVYFASKTIEMQLPNLKILDRPTLKLLIENDRLKSFMPQAIRTLSLIYDEKVEKHLEIRESSVQPNVCFISDTDNRENFPSDVSFHAFRKQRDLFYEILRIWESNHLVSGWNFWTALTGKIKTLLNLHNDPANLIHFSRLFKAQLLSTCRKFNGDEVVSEAQLTFLSSLPNLDVEKLSRLKSRLVNKQVSSGINAVPSFPGQQEFYKDFLLVGGNHAFNRHLSDSLIYEIVELNQSDFCCSDDTETVVDLEIRKSYLSCTKSLRILAKFLGFLESLPYKTELVNPSENVLASQLRIRQMIEPNLNLKRILDTSLSKGTLILTIPWITEFLAVLDHVTLRLPYFEDVCRTLFDIHCRISSETSKHFSNIESKMLIKLCLGWLFELPHFPDGLYFKWWSNALHDSSLSKGGGAQPKNMYLDQLDIVEHNVLYACCPYLEELKTLLSSSVNSSSNVKIKHITPLTAVQSPPEMTRKRLEVQLEEAFFNGQPVSVRKTVEFVSERVASVCVKRICYDIVPEKKKDFLNEFKNILLELGAASTEDRNSVKFQALLKQKASEYAVYCIGNIKYVSKEEVDRVRGERIQTCLASLLPFDVAKQTEDACVSIASRMCAERVQQWVNSHLNAGIFAKDFDSEIVSFTRHPKRTPKDKTNFTLPPHGKNIKHNPDVLSAVKLVDTIRAFSLSVLEHSPDVSSDKVIGILEAVEGSLGGRCDFNGSMAALVYKMVYDLALLLIAHNPHIIEQQCVIGKFISYFKENASDSDSVFKSLISPRNVMLLGQSPDKSHEAWNMLTQLLRRLLKEKLLTRETFESQCAVMLKHNWDQATLTRLSQCLQELGDSVFQNGKCTDK